MANPNAPFGARRVKSLNGHQPTTLNTYKIANAYDTAIYYGDWVKRTADGTLVIATAGDAVLGVFRGVYWTDATGVPHFSKSWVALTSTLGSQGGLALVDDDPDGVYEMQSASSVTTAEIGLFCDINTSASGSHVTGSKQQTSTMASTEDNFKIIGFYGDGVHEKPCRNAAGNQAMYEAGTNAVVLIKVVNHENNGAAVGVEV